VRTLITTDCHVAAPYEVLDELPAQYRDWFERVVHRDVGDYVEGPPSGGMTGAGHSETQIGPGAPGGPLRSSLVNHAVGASAEARPSFEPAEVLADLARENVLGAVLITPQLDFNPDRPLDADVAYCRLTNDWNAEQWAPYLDRVAPGIVLPARDVAATVKELERAAAKGLRPALMPDALSDVPYYSSEWEPFWEAANALQIPITMHIGSGQVSSSSGSAGMTAAALDNLKGAALVGWYQQCLVMGGTLGWLTFSGVFERHPDLHVIMTEGYAGWLAFAMQFWDHHFDSRFMEQHPLNTMFAEQPPLEMLPSYYLKRQAHATFMWDPVAVSLREFTGTDCLLWGNDYPHPEGSFPWSQEWIDKQFAGVSDEDVEAMTRGNAARLFKINV
jgi:predicted TIM-barrel fold metal-dependent hydrolase